MQVSGPLLDDFECVAKSTKWGEVQMNQVFNFCALALSRLSQVLAWLFRAAHRFVSDPAVQRIGQLAVRSIVLFIKVLGWFYLAFFMIFALLVTSKKKPKRLRPWGGG